MKTIEQKAKKVPAIRFAGFEDEWVEKIFGESFIYLQNNTLSRAELNSESGLAKNIHYGDVLVKFGECIDVAEENIPFVSDAFVVGKFKNSFLQDGDIVIADTAEDETVGKCTEMQGVNDAILLSGLHTIPSRPKEKYGSKFLGYYLNSSAYHQQLLPLMQGVKVLSISKSALQETNLVIPKDNQEQQKIGSFFSNIDSLISLEQKKYDKLTQVKKSMLEKMFPKEGATVPEIRFANFTGEWEKKKLSEIAVMHARIGWQNLRTSEFLDSGEYMLITGTDFQDGVINFKTCHYVEKERYDQDKHIQIKNGSILITKDGTLGKVAFVDGLKKPATLNAGVFNVENQDDVDDRYLFQYLKAPFLMDYVSLKATGGTIKHLNQNILVDFPVKLPSKSEQQKIGSYFSHLDSLISLQQRKLEKLKNIKKSLLEKMFV